MYKQGAFLLTFFLLFCSSIFAQRSITISGSVVDSQQEPLISATVSIKGTTKAIQTDADGSYQLTVPSTGKLTLVANYMGFNPKEVELDSKEIKSKEINFVLEVNSEILSEVTIEGKSPVQQVRETAFNVTAVEAKKLHNLSADMNQVLNRTTGVRVRESGGTGSDFSFSLNGFSGNQIKFFLDGVPIDNYGSSFTLNNIPINLAERIEVYKGVVPISLGGDALGGAVNIVTKKHLTKYVDVSYSFGSFNTHKASVNSRFVDKSGFVVNFNAFGNYADNNYKVDVEAVDKTGTGKFLESRKYKRFHDGYKSGTVILEAGLQGKTYADYLLVGITVTGNKDELQHGSTMNRVVGEAFKDSKGYVPSLKYKKTDLFVDGLDLDASSSYNISTSNSVDTCSRVYNWNGTYGYRGSPDPNAGELGEKKHYVFDEKNLVTTTNLVYRLTDHHAFGFNHTYTDYKREEDDKYKEIDRPGKPTIRKHTMGLSYNLKAIENRLNFSVFGKLYKMDSKLEKLKERTTTNSDDLGYGSAIAFQILPTLQAKTSYEYAYRLPSHIEMLGDGIYVQNNVELKPEKSHNFNLGLLFNKDLSKDHFLSLEGNFIYREAEDFIKYKTAGTNMKYENEDNIRVVGLDGVVRYAYSNWLQWETNVTWQKTTNANKIAPGSTIKNTLYGTQMPNTPIFYGNSDLSFLQNNLFMKEDNLTLTVGFNYVASFYLEWPALGEKETKKSIPEQFTQNASVTYSLLKNRYNISLECQNISNRKVYDYYKVQRPGRSFNFKLRYFFNK